MSVTTLVISGDSWSRLVISGDSWSRQGNGSPSLDEPKASNVDGLTLLLGAVEQDEAVTHLVLRLETDGAARRQSDEQGTPSHATG